MTEVAVALQKAEAARILDVEVAEAELGRVDERPPDPLAGPGLDQEPVGIVHLGAPVAAGSDFDGNLALQPADVALYVSQWFNALVYGC